MKEEEKEQEENKMFERQRTFPVNQLDSSWLSAEPDYTKLQERFYERSHFAEIFSIFNSGMRLSKLSPEESRKCEYDLITCGDALDLGLYDFALSTFYDVACILETRQSEKGFRTEAMNKITQEVRRIEQNNNSKNVFGGKKKDDQ